MKKLNRKRIAILILLVAIVIFEIIAFRDSRANKMIEATLATVDNSGFLEMEETNISAINSEESGYYIFLPEYINGKRINKYIVKQTTIQKEEKQEVVEKEKLNEEIVNIVNENISEEIVNEISNNEISNNEIEAVENNTEIKKDETVKEVTDKKVEEKVEKLPKEKIYLTEEEVNNRKVSVKVEYDKIEKNSQKYYYKQIEEKINSNIVKIKGYMPLEAKIKVQETKQEEIDKIKQEYETGAITLQVAYDIKIIIDDKEYEPSEIDENVEVIISGMQELSDKAQKHKVLHVKEEKIEEINEVITNKDEVSFKTDSFSTYAILLDSTDVMALDVSSYALGSSVLSKEASVWDGSISNYFKFGGGNETNPYIITTASELACIAQQVNYGNAFENVYFQLARDIDLNGRDWTPIGTTTNSFRGKFDGAGHIIANANIKTPTTIPTGVVESYGIFGSIGGSTWCDAEIKDLEISDINIDITGNGNTNTSTTQKGYHIGILTGSIYQRAKISNVIVKNSTIADSNKITIRANSFQLSVGGIAGYASKFYNDNSDPGNSNRYAIENCFVDVDINLDIGMRGINYIGQYHSGGIIGTIRSQPVWPVNCLYVGQNNATNGFTGPIFGALINSTSYTSYRNYATLWNGNDAGNLTLNNGYYSGYSTNGTIFTQTISQGTSTYRRSSSSSNIGSVQGVNKGIYMNDISQMLSIFNNYSQNDVTWKYENGTYSFISRISTTIKDNMPTYTVEVTDTTGTGPYTYRWYINDVENYNVTGNTITQEADFIKDYKLFVLTSNGTYYAASEIVIPKLTLYIEFITNTTNNSVTAKISGTALPYIDLSEYTYQWYKQDMAGEEIELLEGKTTKTLTNLEKLQDYKIIATHNSIKELSLEANYTYGDRNVIYVNYNSGNDNNDGKTPETAVRTITKAYNYLPSDGEVKSNVVVIIGYYSNNDYISANNTTNINNFSKKSTVTGKYQGTDYEAGLYFGANDNNTGRILFADTCLEHMILYGSTTGSGSTYFYVQGHSLTMGEKLYFQRYSNTQNTNALVDNCPAPDFHIIGGFSNYNKNTLSDSNNNGTITIKSGTYARIITGSRNTQVNNTAHNFTGTKDNPYNMKIVIDIKNSTTSSNYKYDVNLLVGGQTDGNVYANTNLEIKNGRIGRILGGSIRL